ncbi:hypothetical protein [Nocardioides jiangxiensis]|uniref:Uncharacterized protein n=1 Tax=Nocardioides jiangxiensis TaxID=3064524 RepID=A0ABT9AYG9_9ACTN|nr:hypothetical protein [Nocardioides sp. WY-20]MDO7867619.1 hypothetical protein [Nocardioides sp. WY-20]
MNTSSCRYYRSGVEHDLSITLHRESVRRGAGAPPYPVLERLDLTGLWLPVDASTQGHDGFVELAGLEPIGLEEAAAVYRRLGEMRLIPPTTPLPVDLAEALGHEDSWMHRPVGSWVMLPLLLSGTLLVCLGALVLLALAWMLLT